MQYTSSASVVLQCKLLSKDMEIYHLVGLCGLGSIFTCVSYAEARNRYRLDVCPSVSLSVRPSHDGIVSKQLNILS